MVEVLFTDAAIDDLRKLDPDAVPKVLKKVLLLLDSPQAGYPLGGELTGFRNWSSAATRGASCRARINSSSIGEIQWFPPGGFL